MNSVRIFGGRSQEIEDIATSSIAQLEQWSKKNLWSKLTNNFTTAQQNQMLNYSGSGYIPLNSDQTLKPATLLNYTAEFSITNKLSLVKECTCINAHEKPMWNATIDWWCRSKAMHLSIGAWQQK